MKQIVIALLSGLLFGVGLMWSQMANPNKVLNFLDLFGGHWDASLMMVMIGALAVTMPLFQWLLKRSKPLYDTAFHVSRNKAIDKPLLIGAAIFGLGWGMTGYCPGPALANLGLGNWEAVVMIVSIYAGFLSYRVVFERKA